VHEAYLKLSGQRTKPWANEKHFYLTAAEAMRRILIDSARRKLSRRHGGDLRRTASTVSEIAAANATTDNVLDVDSALAEFAKVAPDRAELVKLRFFGGLLLPQAAAILGISEATAKRQWAYARAWLHDYILRNAADS
jgi:RNA polymerase sigma factor (TIGR02999 family)